MGIGWDYFNNVCQAVRATYSFLVGVVSLMVVCLTGWGVMQFINSNRAPEEPIVQAATAPAAAAVLKPNPQFKTMGTPGTAAPSNAATPAASAPNLKPNPQFQDPRAVSGSNAGTPAAPSNLKPNPQFAPNPQFH